MKTRLLKKIRKQWSITYYPKGFFDKGDIWHSEQYLVLRKKDWFNEFELEYSSRVYGNPNKSPMANKELIELKDTMLSLIKQDYKHLWTAKDKVRLRNSKVSYKIL